MARAWDIGDLSSTERSDAVHDVIARMTGSVNIRFPQNGTSIEASGTTSHVGPVTLATVRTNAMSVERTNLHIGDGFDASVYLGLQIQGSSTVIQHGRQATLRPGDLIVYDSTEPYTIVDTFGIWQHFFKIPMERLALPLETLRKSSATNLAPGHPISNMAAHHFARLAADPRDFEGLTTSAVGQPSIDLLRVAIATHCDGEGSLHREILDDSLPTRIMEFIRSNLANPDLGAALIAAEHHISIRYLYKILAAEGVSLAEWVRTRRLEECKAELSSSGPAFGTIETVARRWGFTDMSSFSRSFRTAYGMTPRDWRSLHRNRPV